MPASADARDAVEREVAEFERLCMVLEKHLVAGEWDRAAAALRESRRATHAFLNAMETAVPVRDEAFDQSIYARMRRVFDLREDQLGRLRQYHDDLGSRLQTFSRWKNFARSIGAKNAPPKHSVGLDRMS